MKVPKSSSVFRSGSPLRLVRKVTFSSSRSMFNSRWFLIGPPPDVAGQVGRHAVGVTVALLPVDDPRLAPGFADELAGVVSGHVRRQLEVAFVEQPLERFAESLPQWDTDHLRGDQFPHAGSLPLAIRRDAAGRYQAVDVDVGPQGPRPSVEVEEQPRLGAEELGLLEDREDRLADGAEEEIADEALVVAPEEAELGGQRAGDVEVIGGQDALAPLLQPLVDLGPGADGAGAMPTGVIPPLQGVALGAFLDVAAQGGRAAVAQRESGLELERHKLEEVPLEELLESELEDVAEGILRAHIVRIDAKPARYSAAWRKKLAGARVRESPLAASLDREVAAGQARRRCLGSLRQPRLLAAAAPARRG